MAELSIVDWKDIKLLKSGESVGVDVSGTFQVLSAGAKDSNKLTLLLDPVEHKDLLARLEAVDLFLQEQRSNHVPVLKRTKSGRTALQIKPVQELDPLPAIKPKDRVSVSGHIKTLWEFNNKTGALPYASELSVKHVVLPGRHKPTKSVVGGPAADVHIHGQGT